ncbi:MAG TPA: lipase family protein [Terriglobales bacterium]|nr:lipase family protein [Terriglobales bacterium]
MDLKRAIQFGLLVKAAENIPPANIANAAGQTLPATYDPDDIGYKIVSTIIGNDLATNINPERGHQIVSFGFILQAPNHDVVIAIRGTAGIWEWVHDCECFAVRCPFLAGAGRTDDGFTSIYNSLCVATSARLVETLSTLPFDHSTNSLTICGHSLGGALATLLALDVTANTNFKNPTVYTFGSPRTGDSLFVSAYNQAVPNTYRIANRVDIVPKLPLPPLYEHAAGLYELNPVKLIPPAFLVKCEFACEHHMTSYLHLLSLLAGGTVQPLDAGCVP